MITTQDTVADFNPGYFYHTGLTANTANGGDANGQVRLLNVGINPTTWISNVIASGLPAGGLYNHAATVATSSNGVDTIYVAGGNSGSGPITTTCYTNINTSTHAPGTWTCPSAASLPAPLQQHTMVTLNGYLYVIGGLNNTFAPKATVYKSSIASGPPGAFSATSSLPVDPTADGGLYQLRSVAVNGRIYVTGGVAKDGQPRDYIFIGTPDGSGNLTWQTSAVHLPTALYAHQLTKPDAHSTNPNSIYLMGGINANGASPDTYFTTVNANGTLQPWTAGTNMRNNWAYGSAVAFADQVYIAGGATNYGGSPESNIVSDLLDPTGNYMGVWSSSPVLSSPRVSTAAVSSHDGWIYVIEGGTGGGNTPLTTLDYGPTAAAIGDVHYAPDGKYTSPAISYVGPSGPGTLTIQKLVLSTHVPTGITMTVAWRASNDPSFGGVQFGTPAKLGTGTQTTDIPVNVQNTTYVQYQVEMFSDPTGSLSPVLNRVDVYFDVPPTVTPTPTNTTQPIDTSTPTSTATPTASGTVKLTKTPTSTLTPKLTKTPTSTVTPTAMTIQDNDYRVQYGGWKGAVNALASGGTYKYSTTPGDKVAFKFTGTSAYWVTQKSPMGGYAQVYADGVLVKTVNLYKSSVAWKVNVPIGPLVYGTHTIVINVTGTADPASADTIVLVDGFKVGTTVYKETGNLVQYNGWIPVVNTLASGGTFRNNPGNAPDLTHETASFSFYGTSVTWRTELGPKRGQAEVYIDGIDWGMKDLYRSANVWKKDYIFSGLSNGPHVITIQVLGTKNALSIGNKVSVDAFVGIPY